MEQVVLHILDQRYGIMFLMKKKPSLNSFQKSIRKWIATNCPCRICSLYGWSWFYWESLVKIICQPMKSVFYATNNDTNNIYYTCINMDMHICFMYVHVEIFQTSPVFGQCFCLFVLNWLIFCFLISCNL